MEPAPAWKGGGAERAVGEPDVQCLKPIEGTPGVTDNLEENSSLHSCENYSFKAESCIFRVFLVRCSSYMHRPSKAPMDSVQSTQAREGAGGDPREPALSGLMRDLQACVNPRNEGNLALGPRVGLEWPDL